MYIAHNKMSGSGNTEESQSQPVVNSTYMYTFVSTLETLLAQ